MKVTLSWEYRDGSCGQAVLDQEEAEREAIDMATRYPSCRIWLDEQIVHAGWRAADEREPE